MGCHEGSIVVTENLGWMWHNLVSGFVAHAYYHRVLRVSVGRDWGRSLCPGDSRNKVNVQMPSHGHRQFHGGLSWWLST